MTREAFICEGVRTPIGRFGGALSSVRPDDLAAYAIKETVARALGLDQTAIDDVIFGNANQVVDADPQDRDLAVEEGDVGVLVQEVPDRHQGGQDVVEINLGKVGQILQVGLC